MTLRSKSSHIDTEVATILSGERLIPLPPFNERHSRDKSIVDFSLEKCESGEEDRRGKIRETNIE